MIRALAAVLIGAGLFGLGMLLIAASVGLIAVAGGYASLVVGGGVITWAVGS